MIINILLKRAHLTCAVLCCAVKDFHRFEQAVKDFHRFEHGCQAPFVFLCFLRLQHSITVIYIALQMMIHYGVIIALGIVSPFHDNMTYPSIHVNRAEKYNLIFRASGLYPPD